MLKRLPVVNKQCVLLWKLHWMEGIACVGISSIQWYWDRDFIIIHIYTLCTFPFISQCNSQSIIEYVRLMRSTMQVILCEWYQAYYQKEVTHGGVGHQRNHSSQWLQFLLQCQLGGHALKPYCCENVTSTTTPHPHTHLLFNDSAPYLWLWSV